MSTQAANRVMTTPIYLFSESSSYYIKPSTKDLTIYTSHTPLPIYRLSEPVFMVHAALANPNELHLAYIKLNGDLSYSVITESGVSQTAALAKLDVRAVRYRRLLVFPAGKMVHIFFAAAHQSIPDLWRIEHRLWNGKTWLSAHLGEIANPREPLYTVSRDSQGNLHFLMITFQGQQSILMTNRFHGVFALWGTTMRTLTLAREIAHMASIMTQDNVHYLFWIGKNFNQQWELGWASRTAAHELSSIWNQTPSPVKIFSGNCRGLGALNRNGNLWLLAHFDQTHLLMYDGSTWKHHSANPGAFHPIQIGSKGKTGIENTDWLEEKLGLPLFIKQLDLPALEIQPAFIPPTESPRDWSEPAPIPHQTSTITIQAEIQNVLNPILNTIQDLEKQIRNLAQVLNGSQTLMQPNGSIDE